MAVVDWMDDGQRTTALLVTGWRDNDGRVL